ncbi:MAG: flagellar motor switch protein FliN [Phycisphaerae bacterium]
MADDPNTSTPDSDADGVFSQDDIDAAFGGDDSTPDDPPAAGAADPSPGDPPVGEAVGQQDIDALMQAVGDSEGGAELTQADIDAALTGASGAADAADGASEGRGADVGELTQADIDAALAGGGGGPDPSTGPTEPAPDETRVDMSGRPFDDAAAAMAAAIAEEKAAAAAAAPPPPATTDFELPDLTGPDAGRDLSHEIDLLNDVSLRVKIELGRTQMMVEDVLRLGDGSVIELDRLAGDPVDVYANDRLVARGEVLVLNDSFCVRVSEIVSAEAAMTEG